MFNITIIIPIHNQELFLSECLESVIKQTLENIEIICVDDGSTDNTMSILKEYTNKYENILLLQQKKSGAGIARNRAIDKARGKYIAFMDSDDFYYNEHVLKLLFEKAEKHNVQVCGGCMCHWNNQNMTEEYFDTGHDYMFSKEELVEYINYQKISGFTRFIYNRELIIENQIYFPAYTRLEDPVFFVKVMNAAKYFVSIPTYIYCYRQRHKVVLQNEMTTMDTWKGIMDLIEISINNSYYKILEIVNSLINSLKNYIYILVVQDKIEAINLLNSYNKLVHRNNTKHNCRKIDELIDNIYDIKLYIKEESTKCIEWLHEISKKPIVIYGAGHIGKLYLELFNRYDISNIDSFVITKNVSAENANIKGIPIRSFNEIKHKLHNVNIIIAVSILYRKDIVTILEQNGIKNYEKEIDSVKMKEWYSYIQNHLF